MKPTPEQLAYAAGFAAQLERLTSGVEMPSPRVLASPLVPELGALFTANQMRDYAAAAVAKKDAYAIACQNEADALRASRDEYQRAVDDMAMEHKVERDTLKAENERLLEALKASLAALEIAQDNLLPHGDNCFLHDEGEYNACFCGKASLQSYLQNTFEELDAAIAAATKGQP